MAKICVPICARRIDEMRELAQRAAANADLLELRLDYLSAEEVEGSESALAALIESSSCPIVLTYRPAEFGGAREIALEDRIDFRLGTPKLSQVKAAMFDLELDLVSAFEKQQRESADGLPSWDWSRTICSFHDFERVPANLDQLFDRMAATPARVIKIAVQADDAVDCLPVWRLLERARDEGREMIAVAMGQPGVMTRILGPSRGSFLTYGSLADESANAPGQLTARDLRELYRVDQINQQTEIIGIIGKPVAHSLSPRIHNAAFAAADLNSVYIPFEVTDLKQFMHRMAHPKSRELDWHLTGLSVTAPHKSAVMAYLDWIEPVAKEIGAVNTIVIRDNRLLGYNTDAAGFIAPLRQRFGSLSGVRCAVIGAGGAARAVTSVLRSAGAELVLFARDRSKAQELALARDAEVHDLAGADFESFDIVVNATPLGTRGERQTQSPAEADQLRNVRLAYDLVYNPLETRFLSVAREAGCETLSGVEMLLAQAIEQFKLWTGAEPNERIMRETVMRALQ